MDKNLLNILDDGETYSFLRGSCVALLTEEDLVHFDLGIDLSELDPVLFDLSNPADLRRLADLLEGK